MYPDLLPSLVAPNSWCFFSVKCCAMVFISPGHRPPVWKCRFPPLFSRLPQRPHFPPPLLRGFSPIPGFTPIPGFPPIPGVPHPRVSRTSGPLLYRRQPYGFQTFFGFFSDYLLSRMESLPGVVDELISTFASYQKDHKGGPRTLLLICFNF